MNYFEESLKRHYQWRGKLETKLRVPLETTLDLSLAYTPGVAQPCIEIKDDPAKSYLLTRRQNTVAVITDGTAVLGLGDIGGVAGMPVMEGKCVLFKAFADIDAIPICLNTKDTDEIVKTIYNISGSFGGINLEDISAPRCFEIEKRLKEMCDIPVFHDDQHGTAIVVAAALLNALRIVKKDIGAVRVVINGAGSAGIAVGKFLLEMGVKNLTMVGRNGILTADENYSNPAHSEIALVTNKAKNRGTLKDALKGADVFIGVSKGGLVSAEMVQSMADRAVVFALANPVPEISRAEAIAAGAAVAGSGVSNAPNQINNVLAFPGVFKGALSVMAKEINSEMKKAAAHALASLITDERLTADYILPSALDKSVAPAVAVAVAEAAVRTGVSRG